MNLDAATRHRLDRFATLLLQWNARLNLIAPGDTAVVWQRHIADSLQLAPLIPADTVRGVDLGTGGGFPGLILALATGIHFDLIESDRRKASFLRTAAAATAAPATIHACRIEAAELAPAPLVTARALAPLIRLLPLAARLLAPDGMGLFLKGARLDAELAAARQAWSMIAECVPSHTDASGVILRVTQLHQAPVAAETATTKRDGTTQRRMGD